MFYPPDIESIHWPEEINTAWLQQSVVFSYEFNDATVEAVSNEVLVFSTNVNATKNKE